MFTILHTPLYLLKVYKYYFLKYTSICDVFAQYKRCKDFKLFIQITVSFENQNLTDPLCGKIYSLFLQYFKMYKILLNVSFNWK